MEAVVLAYIHPRSNKLKGAVILAYIHPWSNKLMGAVILAYIHPRSNKLREQLYQLTSTHGVTN